MFLIDARAPMHEPTPERDADGELVKDEDGKVAMSSLFRNALSSALVVLKNKIIANENDLVGIIFWGTSKSLGPNGFEGVYEWWPVDYPSATRIRKLQEVLNGDVDLLDEIGAGGAAEEGPPPLSKALWAASTALTRSRTKKDDYQRVWLFTNDHDPFVGDEDARSQCLHKARDLAVAQHVIHLFYSSPLVADEHGEKKPKQFDPEVFFRQLIGAPDDDDDDPEERWRSLDSAAAVADEVRKKMFAKRKLASLNFQLAEGLSVALSLYNTVYPAKKGTPVTLDAADNKPLKTQSSWLCEATGKTLMEHDIGLYQEFGGARVPFSREDMAEIKKVGAPGVTLLGFKPLSTLRDAYNMRPPYFVYPSESEVSGSTTAFRALHAKMLQMEKVAIVRFVPRKVSIPRLAALMASRARDGDVSHPDGMYVIPLPFSEDIRTLRMNTPLPTATAEQVHAAKTLVTTMDLPAFESTSLENPAMQKFWSTVQAFALDVPVDWDDEVDDLVFPDKRVVGHSLDAITGLRDKIEGDPSLDTRKKTTASKRKRAVSCVRADARDVMHPLTLAVCRAPQADGSPAKAAKRKPAGDVDVRGMFAEGKLSKCTAEQLKDFLRGAGLRVGGKKADLVERVSAFLS